MKTIRKCAAFVFIILLVTVLSSCISVNTKIQLKENGGGSVSLSYTVSRMIMDLGKMDSSDKFSPLPITRNDFVQTAAQINGLTVKSFSLDETAEGVNVTAALDFSSIDALSAFFSGISNTNISLSTADGLTTYKQLIYSASANPPDENSIQMIDSFFSQDRLHFELVTPRPIQKVNIGTTDEGNKQAVLDLSLPEIIKNNKTITWEVSW